MDAVQFQQHAHDDERLRTLIDEVAGEAAHEVTLEDPQRYSTGADLLFGVAAYALYRWLKDFFDQRRALHEAELLKQQEQVIAALIRDGFPPKEARATVISLFKVIVSRTQDDPALKAARALLSMDQP